MKFGNATVTVKDPSRGSYTPPLNTSAELNKAHLWLQKEANGTRFVCTLAENRADDWPYPHWVDYFLEGRLRPARGPESFQEGIVECYLYKDVVEDDL